MTMVHAGLLHWFTGPYVHRLVYDRRTRSMDIDTVSFVAQWVHHHGIKLDELQPPNTMRPQVTFQVSGQSSSCSL